MPKPKRRPTVVKTDWVVETKSAGLVVPTVFNQKGEAKAFAGRLFHFNPSIYERKWRKVDL